jgi:hypothetical protein
MKFLQFFGKNELILQQFNYSIISQAVDKNVIR